MNTTIKKMIFIPRAPTVQEFRVKHNTFNSHSSTDRKAYADYCTEITSAEFMKLKNSFINTNFEDLTKFVLDQLDERIRNSDSITQTKIFEWAEDIIIPSYFLKKYFQTIGISYADFITWRDRLCNVDIINYTNHFPKLRGQMIYSLGEWKNKYIRIVQSLDWNVIGSTFIQSVLASYKKKYSESHVSFVPIADIRDLTCFQLRITDYEFDALFRNLYMRANTPEIKLKISLDSDSLLTQVGQKRKPLHLSQQTGYRSVVCIRN